MSENNGIMVTAIKVTDDSGLRVICTNIAGIFEDLRMKILRKILQYEVQSSHLVHLECGNKLETGNLKIRGRPRKRITSVELQLDKEFEKNSDFTDDRLRSLAHQFRVSLGYIRQWYNGKCIETRHLDKIRDRPILTSAFRKHRGRPPKPINAAKSELEREFQKDQNFDDNRQNELSRRLNISRNEVFQWYMTRCSAMKRRRGRPPKDLMNDGSGSAEIFCETLFNPNSEDFESSTTVGFSDLYSHYEGEEDAFSAYQNEQLTDRFHVSPYITPQEETELSRRLGLSEFQIRTWFGRMTGGEQANGDFKPNSRSGEADVVELSFDQIKQLEEIYQSSASVITPEKVEELCKEFHVPAKSIYNWIADRHNYILPNSH